MSLYIVFVLFIVRLVSSLPKRLGVYRRYFPWKLDSYLLGLGRQFIYSVVNRWAG